MRIVPALSLAVIFALLTEPSPSGAEQRIAAKVFHVTADGNDKNPGTKEKPFATLRRARDAVRESKRRQPVTVLVHGGTYTLTEPLTLTPADSGTRECPVTFSAAAGEKPVLSGGRRITGWKETTVAGKQLWSVDLPEVKAGKWYFHQLWMNGQRRPRARHPNDGFLHIAELPDVTRETPWNRGQKRFRFAPGDIRTWKDLEEVDVVVLHLWVAVRLAVESVDEKANIVTFKKPSRRRLTDGEKPARYYVENAFELLDAPGEWYLNRKTGVLHYRPMPGEKIAKAKAVAPLLPHLLRFVGKPEAKQYVEYVTVRGLTFAHAEWWPPRDETADHQAAANVPAVVRGDGMRHCVIEGCTVAHASGYGIHLAGGCQYNRVAHCEVRDLGAGGIRVGETRIRDDETRQTHDNAVTDNHLHHLGRIFHQAVGVWVGQSYKNRIAHNHIHDLYYTGLSCGWTWGYGKTLARDNVFEHNHVHDIGQGMLSDMGGIYTLGVQPGTVIRNNVFHDIRAFRYGGWGIYFDEGSSQIVAENNLVYRTTHGGFHQHYGKENVVRNNIFALGRAAQIRRSRDEDHRSFTFERNVVYWKEGKLLDGTWAKLNVSFDHNLYWKVGGGEVKFDKYTWEQWRAKGMDEHSLIADPLFVNPAKGDFRPRDNSPARKVGFVAPDLAGVGPRPPEGREGGRQ